MRASLAVALGGALGSLARYWSGLLVTAWVGPTFPWATLLINVVGSMVIGVFAGLPAGDLARLFVMVGLCGGFTTFSAFSLQTLTLFRDGDAWGGVLNVALSVLLCLLAVALGLALGQRLGAGGLGASWR